MPKWRVDHDGLCPDCAADLKRRKMFSFENVSCGIPMEGPRFHPALDNLSMLGELLISPVVVYMQVRNSYGFHSLSNANITASPI